MQKIKLLTENNLSLNTMESLHYLNGIFLLSLEMPYLYEGEFQLAKLILIWDSEAKSLGFNLYRRQFSILLAKFTFYRPDLFHQIPQNFNTILSIQSF
jgi:hypothetical protein